ncbi:MAG TPA: hypothetical protein VJT71_13740, partial [Pyrinomonadaceae bacterium]|nr:hypothetical protein [Pyrinomonadaceae bacterium]
LTKLVLPSAFLLLFAYICVGQTDSSQPPTPDQKAEAVVQKGIQAVGGPAYLGVQTVIGRGFFTEYRDGVSGVPARFVDYLAYPDRERTEFRGGGNLVIQTNDRDKGWQLDIAARTIKDQSAQQVADFKLGMRSGFENLLHGWWRKEGGVLSYVGRREASLGRRNEVVRLTYPDGFWVEYELAAHDGVPAKAIYKRKIKNLDTDEMEDVTEEDRFFRPLVISGVTAPFVIDHFRNGVQTSRINYEAIEFNKPLADSLFAKPATLKGIK